MSDKIGYLFADRDLTVIVLGDAHDIPKTHFNYQGIVALLTPPEDETPEEETQRCADLLALILHGTVEDVIREAVIDYDDIEVTGGEVRVRGEVVHSSLTSRIVELASIGLPFDPFVRFLSNLSQNPSEGSRESLFSFLEQGRFPLTDDGCFLGYKGVYLGEIDGEETFVDGHTESFDMSPGNVHSMPWNEVDNNRNEACGRGFHVGTIDHARKFVGRGGKMVVVKVNPKDCVSVPTRDTTKLRVCSYCVVNVFEDATRAEEFSRPVYSQGDYENDEWEDEDREYEESADVIAVKQQVNSPVKDRSVPSFASLEEELGAMGRDDVCRRAAAEGFFLSTNEARWAGKEFVIQTMVNKSYPLQDRGMKWCLTFAKKRRLDVTEVDAAGALRGSLTILLGSRS